MRQRMLVVVYEQDFSIRSGEAQIAGAMETLEGKIPYKPMVEDVATFDRRGSSYCTASCRSPCFVAEHTRRLYMYV